MFSHPLSRRPDRPDPPRSNDRTRFVARAALAALLVLPLACGGGTERRGAPTTPEFSVFVTGGLNSQLEPCGCKDRLGGHVRRATLFRNFAAQHPESRVLYLDAGQAFKMDSREAPYAVPSMMEAMTSLHLDALNPGAFELAMGLAPLTRALAGASFPLTSANLRHLDGNTPCFPTSLTLKARPVAGGAPEGPKVGVVAFTVPDRYRIIEGVDGAKAHLIDAIKAADEVLPQLQGQCEAVIAIGNFGRSLAGQLAGKHPELDLIVATEPYIQEEASVSGREVPIYFTGVLGKRQLRFDFYRDATPGRRWKIVGNITTIGDSLLPDPEAQELLKRYSDAATQAGFGRGLSIKGQPAAGS